MIFAEKTRCMKPKKSLHDNKVTRHRKAGLPLLRGMFISPNSMVRNSQTGVRNPFFDPENELVVTTEEWKMLRYHE